MRLNIDYVKLEEYLQAKALASSSIEEYIKVLKYLPENITQETILKYMGKYNNSYARASLKHLFHYIKISDDYTKEEKDYIRLIDIPSVSGRKKRRIPEIISEKELYDIMRAMSGDERSRLMLLVSFYGGLRISEVTGKYAIKPYNFNWSTWLKNPSDNGVLKVIGKGDKQRIVFIPQKIMARLYQWVINYASKMQSRDSKLFNISDRRWREILYKYSEKALNKRINTHVLRHSTGAWLIYNGWKIEDLKEYLGHDDISTTMIYAHINKEELKKKFSTVLSKSSF